MDTLSKTLAGCGGYVAGRRELIDYLRFATPGYVYLVGLPPPLTAIAIEALRIMRAEPERMAAPQCNRRAFLQTSQAAGLDTGTSIGAVIVPVIVGSSIHAAQAADFLFEEGINVHPIIYPAVPEHTVRGINVLATDLAADHRAAQGWEQSAQHSSQLAQLLRPELVDAERFARHVGFLPVDMNAVPPALHDKFDFCWSVCSLEHLGSVSRGPRIVQVAMHCRRPGRAAVHTMDFNLRPTRSGRLRSGSTVLFEEADIRSLGE